jgi:1-phosphatidylinositol-3-phosphate 5-kinase
MQRVLRLQKRLHCLAAETPLPNMWFVRVNSSIMRLQFTLAGQIFCSRCASNIIKGSRFGHDGMIRVCNLCLEKLASVDEDEDDDRRSISSAASPFAAHQFGNDSLATGLARYSQSPFAASQLFGRTDEPFNLFSIAETRRLISSSDEGSPASRPLTPQSYNLEDPWGPQDFSTYCPFPTRSRR